MPVSILAAAFTVIVVATAVQGAVGFGANLLAMPVLVQIDPALVPGPTLLAIGVLNILVMWKERRSIEFQPISEALAGRLGGTALAVVALGFLSERGVAFVVAIVVLAAAAVSAVGFTAPRTRRNMMVGGTVSGFGATTAGIGGPPVALLFQNAPGPQIRGSLALYFALGLAMTLAGLAVAGEFGAEEASASLKLLPAAVLGYLASRPLSRVMDRGNARPAILVLCSAAAIVLLVRLLTG